MIALPFPDQDVKTGSGPPRESILLNFGWRTSKLCVAKLHVSEGHKEFMVRSVPPLRFDCSWCVPFLFLGIARFLDSVVGH